MRKLLMFLLFAFGAVPAFAQCPVWSRAYGDSFGNTAYSVQQTSDGGYILAGEEWSSGDTNGNIYLIKTDSLGDTLWSHAYGGSHTEESYSVQQTKDGGYIVTGYTESFGSRDVYLIKTDSTGEILWTRTYGGSDGDCGHFVQETRDGGYIVGGRTFSFGAGNQDFYLIKTDSLGDTLWTRTYGSSGGEAIYSVQQTIDGGYIVAGGTAPLGGEGDVYLVKTDSSGDTLWARAYGDNRNEGGQCVQQTIDGGYIVVGGTNSFDAGDYDVYLIKTDSTGNILWSRTYGGSGFDWGFSVQQTADGGYIVAGPTWSFGADSSDVYVIKTNSSGDTLWSRTYGGSNHDYGNSVQETRGGGYIVGGFTRSFGAGDWDFMLTKLDPFGNTCIGEFVSSTAEFVPSTVTSPATEVTSPPTIVTSPPTTVTSPATEVTTVCVAIRGDANGSGSIDLADAVYIVNWLFIGGPPPDPLWLGDANCSGSVDLADAVYIVNWLFIGGPPPCC